MVGSIDRNEPSAPTPMASGAPKFDRLPTRSRLELRTAPAAVYDCQRVGIGLEQPPVTNSPTCAMADAPGMFVAMTAACTLSIASACAVQYGKAGRQDYDTAQIDKPVPSIPRMHARLPSIFALKAG